MCLLFKYLVSPLFDLYFFYFVNECTNYRQLCLELFCVSADGCENGGTCSEDSASTNGFACECPAEFTGETCETGKFN